MCYMKIQTITYNGRNFNYLAYNPQRLHKPNIFDFVLMDSNNNVLNQSTYPHYNEIFSEVKRQFNLSQEG